MTSSSGQTKVAMLADVGEELTSLADQLETLTPDEWSASSLCGAWSVKQVVAHVTLSTRESLAGFIWPMIRSRGDFDRINAERAVARAEQFTSEDLIGQLRASVGVDRKFALASAMDPLTDLLVHGQDIMRPLGRSREMPLKRVLPALDNLWASRFVNPGKRFQGIRFTASDAEWSRGQGTLELKAPAGDLLLVVSGRPAGVAGLEGAAVRETLGRLTR